MFHLLRPAASVLCVAAAALLTCITVHAQPGRVALLIGNGAYKDKPLANPGADVREMQAALVAVGFSVQTVLDANQATMKRAVRDFGQRAAGAEIAFLYYAGHGTQASGENYLIPVQATIEKEADYDVEAISANAVMRQIAGARPRAAIVVLDACRDNPFASATRGGTRGLSRMDAPTGTMIAFATAPNSTATDEGAYARALARQIRTPGLELLDVFRNTNAEVRRVTGGKQDPRISEMSINERVYFLGRAEQGRPPSVAQPAVGQATRAEADPGPANRQEDAVVAALTPRPAAAPGASRASMADVNRLLSAKNCMACHAHDSKRVGPSFNAIRERYADGDVDLTDSILRGGAGKWGPVPMPANVALSREDAALLSDWIRGR